MNQMDENYWKQLAQDWINRKQTQSHNEIPNLQIPDAPKISFSDNNKNYDNLAVADMDIEDVKEEQPVQNHLWNAVNQISESALPFSNIQKQQFIHVPGQLQFPTISNVISKHHEPASKSFMSAKPLIIPDPPTINIIEDQINTVDMDMDNSDMEDDSNSNSASSVNMMDVQKRKKLPIWIREGLERMKREKELEEARIQEEQRQKEEEENRKKLMEEALKEIEREKKVSKSKYESSDSEHEETEKMPQVMRKIEPPIENDEEAYEEMMLLVRKTVTSLLLEVTDEKIQEISNETLSKYRKKASATTKPALIIGLGLGAYSSSTDEEDSGDENGGNNSDWEPESVIKERIYQKQLLFEKRFKERMEKASEIEEERGRKRSSRSEPEQLKYVKSRHSDSDDDRQKISNKSTRKDGEEKYETMIYSISTSSGPIVRVQREKKTRFSDPKDGRTTTHMTHVGMLDSSKSSNDNGTNVNSISKIIIPPPPPVVETPKTSESPKKEKKEKRRRRESSTTSSSSDSGHRKKHKKHKKSSKHSKKSSKKREKSRSRSKSRDKRHHSSRSDRHSIESKSSIRSSESSRRRSKSRSRSRDKHRRRY